MENNSMDFSGMESMVDTWMQSVNFMMGTMTKAWSTCQSPQMSEQFEQSGLKWTGILPEITAKFSQAVINSLSELQEKIGQNVNRFGESVEACRFENMEEPVFQIWGEIYEKEFQKFFHIPQFGLAREYQERLNTMMDKFNLFQANHAEFLRMLYLPFQRSVSGMQEELSQLAEAGRLPDDGHEYYRMWVNILEGHFMTLFQTPEYAEVLAKTISTLAQFSEAKDAVLEDMIKGFPIALQSEMDDLAREVYELKRSVRRMEKKNKTQSVVTGSAKKTGGTR